MPYFPTTIRRDAYRPAESHSGKVLYASSSALYGRETQFEVRLAETPFERSQALALVNKKYGWRGYGKSHTIPRSNSHATFLAYMDNRPIGTITLEVDSPAGIAADGIFLEEINEVRRQPGSNVCELIRLAFDTDIPSHQLLAPLFHVVFIYGRRHYRCTDLFIEINPRHRRFYETMLGFRPIAALKPNPVVDAPAQLMCLQVSDIAMRISEQAARPAGNRNRSLYPFFLNQSDEQHVTRRIAGQICV